MPTSYQFETEPQRRSQHRLASLLKEIHRKVLQAARYRLKSSEAEGSLGQLEAAHPEFAHVDVRRGIGSWLLVVGVLLIYCLDYILFSATAEFLARRAFYDSPWMVTVARAIVPLVILGIEIVIAIQLYFAREEAVEEGTSRAFWMWVAVALLFAFVMPVLVVATQLATQPVISSPSLATIFRWQLVGLVVLALVPHITVLFGGRAAHEAKAYLAFKTKQGVLRRNIRRSRTQAERLEQAAAELFSAYLHNLNAHNNDASHPPIAPGPFNAATRTLLNGHFGYEIIQAPNGAGANNNGGSSSTPTTTSPSPDSPPQPPPSEGSEDGKDGSDSPLPPPPPPPSEGGEDGKGEAEYLRTILSRRVRDAESEVQV